jgi:hypothetical protein
VIENRNTGGTDYHNTRRRKKEGKYILLNIRHI